MTKNYSLTVGDQKPEIKETAGQAVSEGSGEESFLAASSFWGPKCYLICGCITPTPASDFTRPFSLRLCVFSFLVSIRTLVIGFRAHCNPG